MQIPTLSDITELHQKYAPDEVALESVWTHCQIVRDLSLQIAENITDINIELLTAGALLHDIGVYKLYIGGVLDTANYITHGLRGYELLQKEYLDDSVCRFALLHTGVGISKQEVIDQKLPIPARNYIADTMEEKIVMYADKFHSKTTPPTFNSGAWYAENIRSKFGELKAQQFKQFITKFGEPDLSQLAQRYSHNIR